MSNKPRLSRMTMSHALSQLCVAATLLAGLLALPITAMAQGGADTKPTPRSVLIFDGSGSMWGKLDGEKQIKLALARDAVKAAVGKMSPQSTQLGLMSFGHRRAADCSDVQVIAQPEAAAPPAFTERIMTPLEKLNPRGKGPLTAALREAAKLLGKTPGPRSIVLLHDDPDNCQQDPCAALAELQEASPGIVVHVVGLGLKPDDANRYQCLTKPTGGRHVNAQDGAGIAAGIGDVLQLAALGTTDAADVAIKSAPVAVAAPSVVAAAVITAPIAPAVDLSREGPPAIRVRALVSKDRLAAGQRVRWLVSRDAPREEVASAENTATETEGVDAVIAAEPGSYKVRATAGLVQAETTVTVAAKGQALAEVVFDAGEIRIKAPLAADATVMVAERGNGTNDGDGKRANRQPVAGRRLGVWPHGQTSLLVPARALLLTLEQGELRSTWPIEVAAGQIREIDVGQAGGRVNLDLQASVGPPIGGNSAFGNQPVVFTIEEDDPDAPRGRRELARSAASTAEFVVAPGTYMIAARRGPLQARERIAVAAGEVVRRSLPLVASRIVISARLGKAAPVQADRPADSFLLTSLDDDREPTVVLAGPAAIADVPPGRYKVEARRNNAAIKAEQVIDVRAGEYRAVTLEYLAGELRLEIAASSADTFEPAAWRVVDANGRMVGSGDTSNTSQLLAAGRYSLRSEVNGKRREQAIEIRPGEVSSVRLE